MAVEIITRYAEKLGVRSLVLAPVTPFTPSQRMVAELRFLKGLSYQKISIVLGISPDTVKNHLTGSVIPGVGDDYDDLLRHHKSELGIFGIIQSITHNRPANSTDALRVLAGDVIFLR